VLERMGLPFYFAEGEAVASFLEGDAVKDMTDGQIEAILKGSVFCDGESAAALISRGYGDRLGVCVSDWDLGVVSGETFDKDGVYTCTKQKNYKKLTINDGRTEALSYNYLRQDDGPKLLAPAVTKHVRDDGRLGVVFAGSPHAPFSYGEGFAFLNETRKAQLVSLLREAGALPVYAMGDAEICLRAGYLVSGELLCAVFELGIDPEEQLYLNLEKDPESIKIMLPDGSDTDVKFEAIGGGAYRIDVKVEPMYPIILIIK